MDVLHVLHQFPPDTRGGSESYVRDVVLYQRAHGVDAQVLSGTMQPRPQVGVERRDVDGIPVHRLHRADLYFDHHAVAWNAEVSALYADLLRRWRPRVVHLHHWVRLSSDLVAVAHGLGIPTVVTLHDFYTSCPRAFRMRKDSAACRRPLSPASCRDCVPKYGDEGSAELDEGIALFADGYRSELALAAAVLVTVGSTADLLAASTGTPRARYRVLSLGYRRRFGGAPPLPEPAAGETFRFAYWGSVGAHKGIDVLLAAFAHLRQPGVDAELHVLGDLATPELAAALRQQASGLPVTFHGPFTPAELRRVAPHAGVFPSTCLETFGIVLDECFELGLPAIVSDHGALPERAAGGGLRVPPGDAAALAEAMARLVAEPALRARLRAARPALPPELPAHCAELAAIYAAATPGQGAALPGARRLAFAALQQATAARRVWPPGGPR